MVIWKYDCVAYAKRQGVWHMNYETMKFYVLVAAHNCDLMSFLGPKMCNLVHLAAAND